jgi:hypothetical protein
MLSEAWGELGVAHERHKFAHERQPQSPPATLRQPLGQVAEAELQHHWLCKTIQVYRRHHTVKC